MTKMREREDGRQLANWEVQRINKEEVSAAETYGDVRALVTPKGQPG